jgi:hypothetical protein
MIKIPEYKGSGVYSITNLASGKRYIGQSHNIRERVCEHIQLLKANKHYSLKFQEDYSSGDNFEVEILFKNSEGRKQSKQRRTKEREFTLLYDSFNNGYNREVPNVATIIFPKSHYNHLSKSTKTTKEILGSIDINHTSIKKLKVIAEKLGISYESYFILKDGEKI